jgi:hypothetical protein
MMLFNKLAVKHFPVECTLVALQMAATVIFIVVFTFRSIHFGSFKDVLRWSMVVPFFTGMLLTSILALKYAPMSLVVVFRVLSPLMSLFIESFYPDPLRFSPWMLGSIITMFMGAVLYTTGLKQGGGNLDGIGWVVLNVFFAVGDRLLQRLMLAQDQRPVDISKTGLTLLNNLEGLVPLVLVMVLKNEFAEIPSAFANLDRMGIMWVSLSCVVGIGISYTGIWAQSLISATSFLVLVNVNKFVIIFVEAFGLGTKKLTCLQLVGAFVTIAGGVAYGQAREWIEDEARETREKQMASERTPLVMTKA